MATRKICSSPLSGEVLVAFCLLLLRSVRPDLYFLEKDYGATRIGGTGLRDSERIGELVTECTSQRSPGALSETLSECHCPLRAAGPVAPNRIAT